MAFGLWAGGHLTKYGNVPETLKAYSEMGSEAWRLLPSPGPDGSKFEEVRCVDIPGMVDGQFFIALRYWRRCKRFLLPGDWRGMTVAQLRLIELFDGLYESRPGRGG